MDACSVASQAGRGYKSGMHFTRTVAVGGLTALAVLSDEVVDGRSLTSEARSDLAIGFFLFVVALALLRRWSAQTQVTSVREAQRQAREIDEVVLAVSRGGRADAVLGGLPRRACEILGVEKSIVVVQDVDDPRSSSVVAGHGVPEGLLGARFGIDEGMFGEVMLSGSPVLVDIGSALNPAELSRRADALGPPILSNVVGFATGAATLLAELLIMLILSFYFMVDGARLSESLVTAVPRRS